MPPAGLSPPLARHPKAGPLPATGAPLQTGPVGRVGVHPAGAPAAPTGDETLDDRSFWATIPAALVLPFMGRGVYWVLAVGIWSVVVALLGFLGSFVPIIGFIVYFFAFTSLLAFACDYHRTCLWAPPTGEREIDRAPETDPALILHKYVKKGLHLSLFSIASQIPLLWWILEHLVELDFMGLLSSPMTWLLAALPSFYWPMAVAMTALGNDFAHVWHLPAGLKAIFRAPLEYLTLVTIGYVAFGLSWGFFALFGNFLGVAGSILAATAGLPLGISHGIFGALTGHLLRARPEVFE